jgi:hypothetical protein
VSLTFHLVMDSKLPTERKVQQGDSHLQVEAGKPHEEPVDIEAQIFVNRTEYSRRLLESLHMCLRRLLYSYCRCRDVILASADIRL